MVGVHEVFVHSQVRGRPGRNRIFAKQKVFRPQRKKNLKPTTPLGLEDKLWAAAYLLNGAPILVSYRVPARTFCLLFGNKANTGELWGCVQVAELPDDSGPRRRPGKRLTSPERWEVTQLIKSGVLDPTEYPTYDEEGQVCLPLHAFPYHSPVFRALIPFERETAGCVLTRSLPERPRFPTSLALETC